MPDKILATRVHELLNILKDKLRVAMIDYDIEDEDDYKKILVCNNGCWLIGEIANKVPEQVKEHLTDIINILGDILGTDIIQQLSVQNEQTLRHFAKTISITLGRLGQIDPQQAAHCLPKIIKQWCLALRYISVSEEKVQAFRGLCAMIPYNPIGIADSFPYFCEALIEFSDPPQELEHIFQNLIFTYKQCLGEEEWNSYIESFPP